MTALIETHFEPRNITAPGVYELPDWEYHADPVPATLGGSLSASGARLLLPPSCPARFDWQRRNPRRPTDAFDFGQAAHRIVLGAGAELARIEAKDWRTNDAKDQRQAARDEGLIPLLAADYDAAQAMAAKVFEHPLASRLFKPGSGLPEQSLFWQDTPELPWRRARLDWLPSPVEGRRMVIPDYKTARSAAPSSFGSSAANYGYAMQAAWYCDAVVAMGLDEAPAFVFVVQEKDPPYLVSVLQLDAEAHDVGRAMNARALQIYAECVSSGEWPGYPDGVELVSLPSWFVRANEEVSW